MTLEREERLGELGHSMFSPEVEEGWLLPEFDCPCDWQPGCMAPKPEGCDHWPQP